jgi:hypothetical protein
LFFHFSIDNSTKKAPVSRKPARPTFFLRSKQSLEVKTSFDSEEILSTSFRIFLMLEISFEQAKEFMENIKAKVATTNMSSQLKFHANFNLFSQKAAS